MKLTVGSVLFFLGFAQFSWGQANGTTNPVRSEDSALAPSSNDYVVLGATPKQEAVIRSRIQIMRPPVHPIRVIFVPHWKYVDNTRVFHLHVPTGYTSALFTHLPSRTVFIDTDRYINDESLAYWLAHELGHLATNSPKEEDAEKAAHEFRKRLKDHGIKTYLEAAKDSGRVVGNREAMEAPGKIPGEANSCMD